MLTDSPRRTLDRYPSFDPRSRQYPIRELLTTTRPRSYTWRCPAWLNQGSEGACVGHAWAHELAARPASHPVDSGMAFHIYREAQKVDQWPGEDYSGTSVLAGAKITKSLGYLVEYRWAFGLVDVLATVSRHGPVVLGVPWYEGMYEPGTCGHLHPTGDVVGGHALIANAVSVPNRTVTVHNSWGRSWGNQGTALIAWDDLEALLYNDGEACVPVTRVRYA